MTVMDGQKAKTFGPALVLARQAAGLTQSQLAAAAGVPQSSLSVWERGEAEPSPETVFLLEEALGLNHGDLSQVLGYVRFGEAASTSVQAVINSDPTLDAAARQLLIQLYQRLRSS